MTFVDWSDFEEMLGLLIELVADERNDAHDDRERRRFLDELAADLERTVRRAARVSVDEAIEALRTIVASAPPEFASDPVMTHVEDCLQELERIRSQSSPRC